MADPVGAKFFQANVELENKGVKIEARGLVSERGVTRLFFTKELPPEFQGGQQPVKVKIDFLNCRGVLLKQIVASGTYYEVEFVALKDAERDYLRQRLAHEGISPGWQRQFPRIPVGGMGESDLPVPHLAVVHFVGQEIFVSVRNFTVGGIRVETMGDDLGELRVGSRIILDLMNTTGELLNGITAEVKNISVDDRKTPEGRKFTRSFGLKLVDLDPVRERRYREWIRDYCLTLKKKTVDDAE